ncbi:MAG: hypothetical protein J5713_02895 [Clostridia bacterium]|nr:hypothetical protein [Clostridia bacterium]
MCKIKIAQGEEATTLSVYILPVLIIGLIIVCVIKKVKVYDCFLDGAKDALSLVKTIFPYIATIFVAVELFSASGLSTMLANALSKPLSYIGIPSQIVELLLLVPLSGNGTIALLEKIITECGVDSYPARAAACIAGGTETVFYISAVYFSSSKIKKLRYAIPVSIFCTLLGTVVACLLCRFM